MGFYISICQVFQLCEKTGKAYYFGPNSEKIYAIPDTIIPEEYRRFIYEKNEVYTAYMRKDKYEDSACRIYDNFPTWEEAKRRYLDADDEYHGWSKADHDLFYEAIGWFARNPNQYVVYWG